MKPLWIISLVLLMGCSTIQTTASKPETFAVCKSADIGTTAIALKSGAFVEKNSLVASTLAHGYFPLIAISVGVYEWLKYLDSKPTTLAVNAVTCGVAAHNAFLLL